jgi:hypothetical protein
MVLIRSLKGAAKLLPMDDIGGDGKELIPRRSLLILGIRSFPLWL